jgi:succinate dehydrogenase / fumarate reductase flavoprotein subunit
MKIYPAVHYSMGGLWVDYEKNASGGLALGSPRNQRTNIPQLYAIGECDYQYHGANRLGANSLLSCIFSGLMVAPTIDNVIKTAKPAEASLYSAAVSEKQAEHEQLLRRPSGGENPYLLHQELGNVMTKAATVVRHNNVLREAIDKVNELSERVKRCSLSDSGNWTNQNVMFTKALRDMFPLAKAILLGALARDECRGAHFKPEFAMPGLTATDPAELKREAEAWVDKFEANTNKWLKSTIASCDKQGEVTLSYEDVDTTLIKPRPRLYGLVGAGVIEEVWKARQAAKSTASDGNGSAAKSAGQPAVAH